MKPLHPYRIAGLAAVLFLVTIPLWQEPFYTRLATRILIYALCAASLDLILGFGGMVSFGHAAFLGVGAYVVGILSHHGVTSAWTVWPAAVGATALLALAVGAVSLRTGGVYFIMITLALAQMTYYFCASLEAYGGDDGMTLWERSDLSPVLDIGGANAFYYLVLGVLLSALLLGRRIVGSRFGRVIRGIRENERRMQSLGFPTFRYKLACFVMAGAAAGLAGVLLANLSLYVSPSTLHWTRSGEILIMVILGGMGTLVGPVLGAATLLVAEEVLSNLTRHWMLFLGPLLILLVLFGEGGMVRWLRPGDDR